MCGFNFTFFLAVLQLVPTAPYRILELGGSEVAAGMFLGFLTYASAISCQAVRPSTRFCCGLRSLA